jgi:hypothetical protein
LFKRHISTTISCYKKQCKKQAKNCAKSNKIFVQKGSAKLGKKQIDNFYKGTDR